MIKNLIVAISGLLLLGLKCSAQNATETPADMSSTDAANSSATETSIESSSVPSTATTIVATTTANYSCRTPQNTSPNLSPFWVTTVLSSVPSTIDVTACSWRDGMETKLVNLLVTARAQSSGKRRKKRAAESGQLALQLVSASRSTGSDSKVSLVYYAMLTGGTYLLPAASVVASLAGVSSSASSALGYSVDTMAVAYEAQPLSTNYLWLIGAIFGSLAAILLVTWAVLFAYRRCLQPYDPDAGDNKRHSMDSSTVDDFYGRHVPDMRANPRLGFSKADIGTIADEVARHLDSHMSDMVAGGADRNGRDKPPEVAAATDEVDETISSAKAGTVESGLSSSRRRRSSDVLNAGDSSAQTEQKQRKRNKRKASQADGDTSARGEGTELPQQRQQSAPAYAASGTGEQLEVDDGSSFLLTEWTKVSQDKQTLKLPDDSAANLPVSVTMDSLPMAAHQMTGLESTREARTLASPYRTADQIARIRPLLEDDLKHQDLSRPRGDHPAAAAADASSSASSSRIISVRPRAAAREQANGPSQSELDGPSQSALVGRSRPVTQVRPAANQDEWDVVRELARRPDSDTRALLGTVRLEVAKFSAGSGGDASNQAAAAATSKA